MNKVRFISFVLVNILFFLTAPLAHGETDSTSLSLHDPLQEAKNIVPNSEEMKNLTPAKVTSDPDEPDEENITYTCPKNRKYCGGISPLRAASNKNVLALLTNGEASLAARLQTLKTAKKSIRIEALEFTGDETGRYIAEILKSKMKEGVEVKIIVDGFSNKARDTKLMYSDLMVSGAQVMGAHRGYPSWASWLLDSGLFHPKEINMRFHEKLWIIDAESKDNGIARPIS